MTGVRLFTFMVCVFGAASAFLPWAALGLLAGSDESGVRLRFGIASLIGFIAVMVALWVTRRARSSASIRATCLAVGGLVLIADVVFAFVARALWRAVAVDDYLFLGLDNESGHPAIGWYVSVVSVLLVMGCALVPRLWRPAPY